MYAGDFALGSTFDVKFTTRRFTTGAPFTLAGVPVISAYPDNSVAEITAGITLTVDFDALTGLHNIRVVATSGNGYAAGVSYALVITTGTVDSVSVVGEVVGSFTIERGAAFGRLGAPAGASTAADIAAVKVDTAAILVDTATLPTAAPGAAGGLFIAGTNAPVTITGSGNALTLLSTAANGNGLKATGNGSGDGIYAEGGATATAHGMNLFGPAGGFKAEATTSGPGIDAIGLGGTDTDLGVVSQTGLATQASVDIIDDFLDTEIAAILAAVDTEVAAIKAKTDSLTFTVANQVDANAQSINDTALVGNGGVTPWGPA